MQTTTLKGVVKIRKHPRIKTIKGYFEIRSFSFSTTEKKRILSIKSVSLILVKITLNIDIPVKSIVDF